MGRHYRYIALVDWDRPIGNPLLVLRIHGSREEMYVPSYGWERADPLCRDWFVNVPITEVQALRLLPQLAPAEPLEDRDPYPQAMTRDAAEGFGTQWFYYAVETPEHPLEDPSTIVRLHYPSKSESWFTENLMWETGKAPGRRVRITEEDLHRLEQVLVRRRFGGADVHHYAIVNPLRPDAGHPSAIARVGPDGHQLYVGAGEWATTNVVSDVRHRFCHGTLIPLTEREAAGLAERWRPHPDSSRMRYYAWLHPGGEPAALKRAWEDGGGLYEETYEDGVWGARGTKCVVSDLEGRVEIDRATAERLGKVKDQRESGHQPDDGRYSYFAIADNEREDVSAAHGLVRSWEGNSGRTFEEKLNPRIDRWRSCLTLYEISTARDDSYAIPITEEVANGLRQILLDQFAARSAGRAPEVPRPLGSWVGSGKVTSARVDVRLLDSLRQVGDPVADAAVAELYELGQVDRVNELLAGFLRNGDKVPKGLPRLLRRYFAESAELPEWADHEVLERGQELWDRFTPHLATVLCGYSLPIRYGSAPRLRHTRRGMESTRLLQDVLTGGGLLDRDGRGLRTVQKVRLLHAATRRQRRSGAEDLPANQEDLAATVGTLSVSLLEGMTWLFLRPSERDREDFYHIWSVVGDLMGVDSRLLPSTYDDGVKLMDTIWRRGRAESLEGRELTAALERRCRDALPGELAVLVPGVIRRLCDPGLVDLLGVEPLDAAAWTALIDPVTALAGLPGGSPFDDRVFTPAWSGIVGKALLDADQADWNLPDL
ncbi:oxygenase MpaB family protein [Amycolatopsis sp., V23-08]|uniref:Oxygenase MpaB family protein n=1 Tax=Amycolatopsis heterodermiae TaxID=3110235 RepID=A0ABU5RNF2_9PSEU|nr:oxygenase MpaB family protein [Amycolatopsis sp., V23-08]MEA5367229.1 oxygenase MpaB family protein [Amycolatopsis sp., V23-08]